MNFSAFSPDSSTVFVLTIASPVPPLVVMSAANEGTQMLASIRAAIMIETIFFISVYLPSPVI